MSKITLNSQYLTVENISPASELSDLELGLDAEVAEYASQRELPYQDHVQINKVVGLAYKLEELTGMPYAQAEDLIEKCEFMYKHSTGVNFTYSNGDAVSWQAYRLVLESHGVDV